MKRSECYLLSSLVSRSWFMGFPPCTKCQTSVVFCSCAGDSGSSYMCSSTEYKKDIWLVAGDMPFFFVFAGRYIRKVAMPFQWTALPNILAFVSMWGGGGRAHQFLSCFRVAGQVRRPLIARHLLVKDLIHNRSFTVFLSFVSKVLCPQILEADPVSCA